MYISFNEEEKQDIKEALDNILDDLRAMYNASKIPVLRTGIGWYDPNYFSGILEVNDKGTYIVRDRYDKKEYLYLEKIVLGQITRPRIKDYEIVYGFIRRYDSERIYLEKLATDYVKSKKAGMEEVRNVKKQYDKTAVIEVEMPETVNQSSIEVVEENGKNIGHIKIGPISLKILTSPNVLITSKKQEKQKRK